MKKNWVVKGLFVIAIPVIAGLAAFFLWDRSRTILVYSFFTNEKLNEGLRLAGGQFTAQNPRWKVQIRVQQADNNRRAESWLTGSSVPDVLIWHSGYDLQAAAEQQLLEPLETNIPDATLQNNFPRAFLQAGLVQNKFYFLPLTFDWWALYYNKTVLENNKIKPPSTWEDFLIACESLRNNGLNPIALYGKDIESLAGWFCHIDSNANGWEVTRQFLHGKIAYTDTRIGDSFHTLSAFIMNDYFQRNAASYDFRETMLYFLENNAAFLLAPHTLLENSIPVKEENRIGYIKFPDKKSNFSYSIVAPVDGFVIPVKAFNRNGAGQFVSFMALAANQNTVRYPARVPAAHLQAQVPDAVAHWAVRLAVSASYALAGYDAESLPGMSEKSRQCFIDILNAPQHTDEYLAQTEQVRATLSKK